MNQFTSGQEISSFQPFQTSLRISGGLIGVAKTCDQVRGQADAGIDAAFRRQPGAGHAAKRTAGLGISDACNMHADDGEATTDGCDDCAAAMAGAGVDAVAKALSIERFEPLLMHSERAARLVARIAGDSEIAPGHQAMLISL